MTIVHAALSTTAVERRIRRFFDEGALRTIEDPGFAQLWREAADGAMGGKLLRPKLVLSTYAAYASERAAVSHDDAIAVAAAFELLHTAFLLHDDVIDGDLRRRGRPNLIALRAAAAPAGADADRALAYGNASAILAGDLCISGALRIIAELDAPAPIRRRLSALLDDMLADTAAGEHADVIAGLEGQATVETIVSVMDRKTARYSFCAPLEAGALLGGADVGNIGTLTRIGRHLGLAFQAGDDELGVFGDEQTTGKSTLSDLREGKETLLIAFAREDRRWQAVRTMFGDRDLTVEDAAAIRDVIEHSGARDRVRTFAADSATQAIVLIRSAGLPAALADELLTLAHTLTDRDR